MVRAAAVILTFALTATAAAAHEPDPRRLPVGDHHVSDRPRAGWVWACRTDPQAHGAQGHGAQGHGAQGAGPWIHDDGTYDATAKAVVAGAVRWPGQFAAGIVGDRRILTLTGLPTTPTGIFPIAPQDPAYRYDRNPNAIRPQVIRIAVPAAPELAPEASCAPGAVGVLLNGAALFSALDAPGRDAAAHEAQDACQGHPQESGLYHHHQVSRCLLDADAGPGPSRLMGYALDGFGIYGPRDETGRALSTADLDECHGRTGPVEWEGRRVVMYHYVATLDFPYTVGCLKGRYSPADVRALMGPPPDLGLAAERLGIDPGRLRAALGPPPPDLGAAAVRLGIGEADLRRALGVP